MWDEIDETSPIVDSKHYVYMVDGKGKTFDRKVRMAVAVLRDLHEWSEFEIYSRRFKC
jgi:hypothetical protein